MQSSTNKESFYATSGVTIDLNNKKGAIFWGTGDFLMPMFQGLKKKYANTSILPFVE
tara:strand:- start:235 stop:405 length:171 start_codon:yes stop_codon:yes gene_type:complete